MKKYNTEHQEIKNFGISHNRKTREKAEKVEVIFDSAQDLIDECE